MKIIYFNQFFPPEHIAAAFRCYENAWAWSQEGAEVTVFTGYPNYPAGKIFDGYDPKLFEEEKLSDCLRVLRTKLIARPNTNIFRRLFSMTSFFLYGMCNIYVNGNKIGNNFDVVLGSSGPIFAALLGWIFARKHHIPFILEVRDIIFLQLVATGKSKNHPGVRLMRLLESFLCRKAEMVICVTVGFKEVLEQEFGIATDKVKVIFNGADADDCGTRRTGGSHLILSYFGTLGISQNVADTLQYAKIIRQYVSGFKYLIIGDGAQASFVRQECAKEDFALFLHGMSPEKLEDHYYDTSLSVVVLRKIEAFRWTIPSKLFQTLGRGIAVLYIGPEGDAADIVRRYEAGIVLTKSVEEDLEDLRVFFSQNDWPDKLWSMGRNGRKAVLKYYSRKELAREYLRELKISAGIDVSHAS